MPDLQAPSVGDGRPLRVVAIGGLLAALGWALTSLTWPFGWDQGVFAWVGDTVARGGLPYRDAWDTKGPVVYLVFGGLQFLFGKGPVAIRIFDLALIGVVLVPWMRCLRGLAGKEASWIGGVLLVLWFGRTGYYNTAQPDGWVGLLMAASVATLLDPNRAHGIANALVVGIAIAVSTLLKPMYGLFLLLPVWWLIRSSDSPGNRTRLAVAGVLGFLVPIGLIASWFAVQGGFDDLVDTYIRFNLAHNQAQTGSSIYRVLSRVYRHFLADPAMVLALAWVGPAWGVLRDRRRDLELVLLWTVISSVCIWMQSGSYAYRWHLLSPVVLLVASLGIGAVGRQARGLAGSRSLGVCVIALLILTSAVLPLRDTFRLVRERLGWIDRATYESSFGVGTSYPLPHASRRLATWIESHTDSNDPILVYSDPVVNYHADRPAIGRYVFRVPLRPGPVGRVDPARTSRVEEFLQDLEHRPPSIIALFQADLVDSLTDQGAINRSRIPAFVRFLETGYRPDTLVEGFAIFVRR